MELASFQAIVESKGLKLDERMSGFQMAKIVNAVLGSSLPPQMMYQYIAKGQKSTSAGYIKSIELNGKRFVEAAEIMRWTLQYAAKKGIELEQVSNQQELPFEIEA